MISAPDLLPVDLVPIDDVQPFPGNPHQGDVEGVASSLAEYGQWRAILVQRSTGYVVAGNTTWKAAKRLGWTHINVTYLDVDDTRAQIILLADNRWGARGTDDEELVAKMLKEIHDAGAWSEAIGYASEDVDKLLATIAGSETDADEPPPVPAERDLYVRQGDVWAIGPHRVACGDATSPDTFDLLLGHEGEVQMIWTDPPYGVEYVGGTDERLTIANDEKDEVALRALLDASLREACGRLKPGRAIYCAGPGGDMSPIFVAALKELGVYRQTIIWVKDQLVLGRSDYHWRHEPVHLGVRPGPFNVKASSPVHYGWRPGAAHWFVTDRTLDTVWEIPRPKRSAEHPTMKPVELVERCILASSKRRDIILDPFLGSGTTIVAAHRVARIGYGIELDPVYAQVSIERIATTTGETPRRVE